MVGWDLKHLDTFNSHPTSTKTHACYSGFQFWLSTFYFALVCQKKEKKNRLLSERKKDTKENQHHRPGLTSILSPAHIIGSELQAHILTIKFPRFPQCFDLRLQLLPTKYQPQTENDPTWNPGKHLTLTILISQVSFVLARRTTTTLLLRRPKPTMLPPCLPPHPNRRGPSNSIFSPPGKP